MEEIELARVALQGSEMFLRISSAAIKEAVKFIKFLVTVVPNYNRWAVNRDAERMRRDITKAEYDLIKARQKVYVGGMNYNEFIKLYGAEERTIINITDTSADRFHDLAKRHKLTYTMLPDLNLADGVFQVMVPTSQADIYNIIIENISKEELRFHEEKIGELEKEIENLKKEAANYQKAMYEMEDEGKEDSEEYRQAEENLNRCETEIKEKEEEIAAIRKRQTGEITCEDYMATNEFAFNHQELFNEMMNQGVELKSDRLSDSILSVFKNDKPAKIINTDQAVADITGRRDILDTDKRIVLCDSTNPENHIVAGTSTRQYEDRTYICTQYDVYADGKKQVCEEFDHGEFTHYSDIKANNSGADGSTHWENMKKEMKQKGRLQDTVLMFSSLQEYEAFLVERKNGKSIFIANPNVAEIAIRMDKQPDSSYHCTILHDNKETNNTYKVNRDMTVGNIAPFLKTVDRVVRKVSDTTENEWVTLHSRTEYEKYLNVVKENTPSSREAEKEISEKIPEARVILEKEGRTESTKQIIELPRDNLFIFPQIDGVKYDHTLFSNNMKYTAELPHDRVKMGANDSLLLILDKEEDVVVKDHKTGLEAGRIHDKNSLNAFLDENLEAAGVRDIGKVKAPDVKIQGGGKNAASL